MRYLFIFEGMLVFFSSLPTFSDQNELNWCFYRCFSLQCLDGCKDSSGIILFEFGFFCITYFP